MSVPAPPPRPSGPTESSPRHVALAEIVAAIGDGEFAVLRYRGLDPQAFAIRGLLQVGGLRVGRVMSRVVL